MQCLRGWIHVTQVCRHWRSIALENSPIWSRPILACQQWAQEMLARSRVSPLTVTTFTPPGSWSDEEVPNPSLKQFVMDNLGRIKELVIQQPYINIPDVIIETARPRGSQPLALESLSLLCDGSQRQWSTRPDVRLLRAPKLKRLHISSLPYLSMRPSTLGGMQNLRELSLARSLGQLGDLEGHRIHLPRLTRLNLEDWVDRCQRFFAILSVPKPLEYIGIEATHNSYDKSFDLLSCLRNTVKNSHLSETTTAEGSLRVKSLSYRYAVAFSTYKRHLVRDTTSAFLFGSVRDEAALSGLRNRIVLSADSCGSRCDLSNPGIFASSALAMNVCQLTSEVSGLFPLRFVVSLYVLAGTDHYRRGRDYISCQELTEILRAAPCIRYLRTCMVRIEEVVRALSPSSSADGDLLVLAPEVKDLTLDWINFLPEDQYVQPEESKVFWSLVPCLAARSRCGSSLDKLELRRCRYLRKEEKKGIEDLGIDLKIVDQKNSAKSCFDTYAY
ncbi:hypothetical protein CONPUDRAFT_168555 [Coniophora puteana RWD-64-598 SS2]|uniref:F-box domain-containing protein n=1 Tax=Coniophora puteana (strain RWD-64-598) TaxID=741705 RepID=A0A5M3MCL8_CONPW|nr:uncharacterized protein CONPUDRAFT_168555 [Coniophora puteana RWD-64-598 SS2]EIW76803.1 hypothetical protein CONPUDRAFT_168555 [Coniophora puteana RWD-64-598 SS2]